MNKPPLEDRMVDFSCDIIYISKQLKYSFECMHLSKQILRSGTSCSLNYGEARSAESKKDFIHKIKIVLKELREVFMTLKIILKANLCKNNDTVKKSLSECNELISIFVKSVQTASGK